MPRTVLKERYESAPEEDEVAHDVSIPEPEDVGKYFFLITELWHLFFATFAFYNKSVVFYSQEVD